MMIDDKVVLVDAEDNAVGETSKMIAHKYPLQRHRAVSVWLMRRGPNGKEILFQQRSRQKLVGALWWGNTICGNVFPNETYEECAQRRLRVELAIEGVSLSPVYKFEYQTYANNEYGEHEIDQVFVGEYEGKFVPNPDEVQDFLWINVSELKETIKNWRQQHPDYPTAAASLEIKEDDLRTKSLSVSLSLSGKELVIVPWTIMMLLDDRLVKELQ
jgi:isopentenyl-diphosphate Delta-isomerase